MRIGIDVDGVLCNTTETLLKVYNEDSGDNLKICDIKNYKIDEFVKEEYRNKIQNYFCENRVWKQIKCIEDSQDIIQKLYDDGHEIYIVTATHAGDVFGKHRWIKRNYPCIKTDNIIRCVNKQLLDLDILIDDYQGNFINAKYKGILMNYPWNETFKQDNVVRVQNWQEVYEEIIKMIGVR